MGQRSGAGAGWVSGTAVVQDSAAKRGSGTAAVQDSAAKRGSGKAVVQDSAARHCIERTEHIMKKRFKQQVTTYPAVGRA